MAHMVKGHQYMHSLCVFYASITEMKVDRSTLDLDSRQKRQIQTRQHSTDRYVARVRARTACMNVCVVYIALASFIYTWDYVSQKNA